MKTTRPFVERGALWLGAVGALLTSSVTDAAPGKHDAIWVAMAKGLKDGCGGSQLICYHGQGSTASSMWFHNADWLDFNSIQSGHSFNSGQL